MADEISFDPDDYTVSARSTNQLVPNTDSSSKFEILDELQEAMTIWNSLHSQPGFNPLPTLEKMADVLEKAIDEFLKHDPDPLDDRHPNRTHPQSSFGLLLKILFRNDVFMSKLIISYLLGRDQIELNVAAARLLLSCVPGLDSAVIFAEPEDFIPQLYNWAMTSDNELLQAYSMGLLGAAVEVADNASKYRVQNAKLIPVALKRLNTLRKRLVKERAEAQVLAQQKMSTSGSFPEMRMDDEEPETCPTPSLPRRSVSANSYRQIFGDSKQPIRIKQNSDNNKDDPVTSSPPRKRKKESTPPLSKLPPNLSFGSLQDLENSCSRWDLVQQYVIGTHKVFPLTTEMHMRLIFQFLTPTGEYQDLLSLAYEGRALDMILHFIDLQVARDVRLTFDALRYLTSLLVHRKLALEFLRRSGVTALVSIPRACMASVGVSTCFYYLSYNDDVMEKVCELRGDILDELVDYSLWCLEHSYESGMASSAMFFTHSLCYKAILERFDRRNGVRILFNYLSTLSLLHDGALNGSFELSEEQMHTSIQSVRNGVSALKTYISGHIFTKLEQIRKAIGNKAVVAGLTWPAPIQTNFPSYKSMKMSSEAMEQSVCLLTYFMRTSVMSWWAAEEFYRLGIIKMMYHVCFGSHEWPQVSGKFDILKNTLETLWISTASPKIQLGLCEKYSVGSSVIQGFSYLIELADASDYEEEVDIQLRALEIIINCCPFQDKYFKLPHNNDERRHEGKRSRQSSYGRDHLRRIIESLRASNALMLLCRIIKTKVPVSGADQLRTKACQALLGLMRCKEIRQIMSKLPLIADNELQALMREPIALEKKNFHASFCRYAQQIIEIATERPIKFDVANPKDLTQEQLWKSSIVNNTKITYNEKELLQLIHAHLVKKGLNETASLLCREGDLPDVPASLVSATPSRLQPMPQTLPLSTPPRSKRILNLDVDGPSTLEAGPSSSSNSTEGAFATPTRQRRPKNGSFPRRLTLRPTGTPLPSRTSGHGEAQSLKPLKGLDNIIVDYFRTQHSQCKNPVTTCPQFSLFYPHKCPEPRGVGDVSGNLALRFFQKPVMNPRSLPYSQLYDERFVFSKFRSVRSICEHDEMYTSCAFSIDDEHIIVGMFSGDVHWVNMESGADESTTCCHSSGITSIIPSKDGNMLLTSSAYIPPLSSLWRLGEVQEHLYDLHDDLFVQFANLTQEKIVGTHGPEARIYDTETGRCISTLAPAGSRNRYMHNRASFSPCDNLILNDGYLWDVRSSSKFIYCFDKMNDSNGGVFHPHGKEIIINSEVWDVRNFRLLHCVPAFEQCKIVFNSTGNIIYASPIVSFFDSDTIDRYSPNFRTFDSRDYTCLTTIDSKRALLDVGSDNADKHVAVVEKTKSSTPDMLLHNDESIVRIYEVGKMKRVDGEREDDDDDDDDEDDDGDDEDEEDDDDDDNSSSGMDDSDEDVFDAIGALEDGSDSTSTISFGETTSSDDSGSWETASNQDIENSNDPEFASNNPLAPEPSVGGENADGAESREVNEVNDGNVENAEGDQDVGNNAYAQEFESDGDEDHSISSDLSDEDSDILSSTIGDDEDDDDDNMDETYRPDASEAHPSSSTTALNPHLRRQQKR